MRLYFEELSASYGKKSVLENVSFEVPSGSITALIGRNGAGKSTLISCLMGEKRDYRGRIMLDSGKGCPESGLAGRMQSCPEQGSCRTWSERAGQGQRKPTMRDVRDMSLGERAETLACLPQILPQPHVTVRELVSFGRTPYTPLTGRLSAADREKIDWAIGAVGLDELTDAFVDRLSGGERKKAFFAMTLAQDTPVVVLDEPTAHLDVINRFEFMALLDDMRRETGKTFLVVMHELSEVLRWADRIVVLHGGGIAFAGTPEDCLAAGIPEECFGIRITGDRENGYAVRPLR